MRILRNILAAIILLLGATMTITAQEITINVVAKYSPMPAQAGLYLDNPGKYFTVSVNNPNDEAYNIFLGIQIEQLTGGNMTLTTPVKRQPSKPITIPAHTNRALSQTELRDLFREMKMSDIIIGGGSLTDFTSGAVGLLPEGNYKGYMTAYIWDPQAAYPQAISNPSSGVCFFDVCYKAPAPIITWPAESVLSAAAGENFTDADQLGTATVIDLDNTPVPVFSWTPSICPCSAGFGKPTYNIEFYELTPGLSPNEVITQGRVTYHIDGVSSTSYALNLSPVLLKLTFMEGKTYVMRVVAKSPQSDATQRNFVLIENKGASPLRIFQIAKHNQEETKNVVPKDSLTDDQKRKKQIIDKLNKQVKNQMEFSVPAIVKPDSIHDLSKKHSFIEGEDIVVKWDSVKYLGGGFSHIADTIRHFKYTVGIYPAKDGFMVVDSVVQQRALASEKDLLDKYEHTFKWKDNLEKATIEVGQPYWIVVTAKPAYYKTNANDTSKMIIPDTLNTIKYVGEPTNTYVMVKSPDFTEVGDCYPDNKIEDEAAQDWEPRVLMNQKNSIGQFELVITDCKKNEKFTGIRQAPPGATPEGDKPGGDKAPGDKAEGDKAAGDKPADGAAKPADGGTAKPADGASKPADGKDGKGGKDGKDGKGGGKTIKVPGPAYQGKGYIIWKPYGKPIKIAVEFDSLRFNKDRICIEGVAKSARNDDENIPYDQLARLTNMVGVDRTAYDKYTDDLKKAGSNYWQYIRGGLGYSNNVSQLLDGAFGDGDWNTDPITLPLSMADASEMIPNGIPLDISLMNMRFSPTTASMDVFVTTELPDLEAVKGGEQVLGFAAPGLCMEPESPWCKSGRIALMYDLTLQNKDQDFEFSFKAPTNYKEITDGTFIEWKDGKFERMRIDVNMTVRNIYADDGTGQHIAGQTGANFGAAVDISDWDDFILEFDILTNDGRKATGFYTKNLEGYTFIPGGKVIYDHSVNRNAAGMNFPRQYDWTKWGFDQKKLKEDPKCKNEWMGIYVQALEIKFPYVMPTYPTEEEAAAAAKGDKGKGGKPGPDNRMGLFAEGFMYDKTGLTCTAGVKNILRVGKMDSFSFTMDRIYFDVVQTDVFMDVGFKGEVTIPLLGGIDAQGNKKKNFAMVYDAKFQHLDTDPMEARLYDAKELAARKKEEKDALEAAKKKLNDGETLTEEEQAIIDKSKQKDWYFLFDCDLKESIHMDWWLANVSIHSKGTYLDVRKKLSGDEKAYVEFVTSGSLGISNSMYDEETRKSLPFKIPDIHFAGLRVANYSYVATASSRFSAFYAQAIDKAKEDYDKKIAEAKEAGKDTKDIKNEYGWAAGKQYVFGLDEFKDMKDVSDVKTYTAAMDSIIAKREIHNADESCFFSIGTWSLASMEKTLWGMPLKLNQMNLKSGTADDGKPRMGLYINGGLDILGNETFGVGATAGFTVWAKVDWDEFEVSYDGCDFNDVQVEGQFGGVVKIEGNLAVSKEEEKSGLNGDLTIDVKGLFKGVFGGGYYEMTKSADDIKLDQDNGIDTASEDYDKKYKAGYFYGEVSEIPAFGPITLNGIRGGFYFNYATNTANTESQEAFMKALKAPTPKYGVAGGAFGFDLVAGQESFVKGDLTMNILIDLKQKCVHEFHMQGNCHALCASPDAESGLVNAKVDIIFADKTSDDEKPKPEDHKYFKLNITADVTADVEKVYEDFTGGKLKIPDAFTDLQEFAQETADEQGDGSDKSEKSTTDGKTRNKSESEKKAEELGYIKDGIGAYIGMELEIRYYPSKGESKWHLYVGEPDAQKRCRLTFIDFALGKEKPVGMWAKLYADFYLCVGNEMPNEGKLPALPEKVVEALNGKGADGKTQTGTLTKLQQAREQLIKDGPQGQTRGTGLMVGASLGAEFGCNAVFCYCDVAGMAGFDAVLKQYASNAKCTDGSSLGGKNGFYATAQIYAMLKGELGLMVDLWIYKGKVPLVDMTLGALLKGGLPNPSWAYGKVRAAGKVLGGLIKFDSSIEMKVGQVCIPDYGNPLDDIKIFGDVAPGNEKKDEGWQESAAVSPYGNLAFTTNMRIDSKLNLVDEKLRAKKAGMNGDEEKLTAQCMRTYIFHLDNEFTAERFQNSQSDSYSNLAEAPRKVGYSTRDHENYTVDLGSLQANSFYKVTMGGYAKEIRDGREVDPIFNDESTNYKDVNKAWHQTYTTYFCTGKYSDNMDDEIVASTPIDGYGYDFKSGGAIGGNYQLSRKALKAEAANPTLMLRHNRQDYWDNPDYEFSADFTLGSGRYPDIKYDNNGSRLPGQTSKYENLSVRNIVETGVDAEGQPYEYSTVVLTTPLSPSDFKTGETYVYTIRRRDNKSIDDYMAKVEETYKNMQKLVSNEQTEGLQQLKEWADDDSNPLRQEMAKYYNEMQELYGESTAEQRIREFKDQMLSNTSAFNTVEYSKTFTVGEYTSVSDLSLDNIAVVRMHRRGETTTNEVQITQWRNFKLTYHRTPTIFTSPYYWFNYWGSLGAIRKGNVPSFRLHDKSVYGQLEAYDKSQLSFSQYRNGDMVGQKMSNAYYEAMISPMGFTRWSNGENLYEANTSFSQHYGMPAIWMQMITDDAKLAEAFTNNLKTLWRLHAAYQSNGTTAYRTPSEMKGLSTSHSAFGNWKSLTASNFQNSTVYTSRVESGLSTAINSRAYTAMHWYRYQDAYMYAAYDSRMGLSLADLGTQETRQPLYMSGYFPGFTQKAFFENIKSVEYDVRRATGYNIRTAQFGLRPSTAGQYAAHIVRPVTAQQVEQKVVDFYGRPTGTTETVTVISTGKAEVDYDDEVFIPDANFRKLMLAGYDKNLDGRLSKQEALAVTEIHVHPQNWYGNGTEDLNVYSVQGIEAMDNLERLTIESELRDLNVSANSKLRYLYVRTEKLKSLDLSRNANLEELHCLGLEDPEYDHSGKSGLTSINLRGLARLRGLSVTYNALSGLDVSSCPMLEVIDCQANLLTALDLTHNNKVRLVDAGRQYALQANGHYYCQSLLELSLSSYSQSSQVVQHILDSGGALKGKYPVPCRDAYRTNCNVLVKQQSATSQIDKNLLAYLIRGGWGKPKNEQKAIDLDSDVTVDQLIENYDLDYDGIAAMTSLTAENMGIRSLDNVGRLMPKLTSIAVSGNLLRQVDLAQFPLLQRFVARDNQIGGVKFAAESQLVHLDLTNNDLLELDCSSQKRLQTLLLSDNSLSFFSAKGLSLLTLELRNNLLSSLSVADQAALSRLDLTDNRIGVRGDGSPDIDLPTSRSALKELILPGVDISSINLKRYSALLTVDLHGCAKLCSAELPTSLRVLNLSDCTRLSAVNGQTIRWIPSTFKGLMELRLDRTAIATDCSDLLERIFVFRKGECSPHLKVLSMVDGIQEQVEIETALGTGEYYIGTPSRGSKVSLYLTDLSAASRWESLRQDPRNGNAELWGIVEPYDPEEWQSGAVITSPSASAPAASSSTTSSSPTKTISTGKTLGGTSLSGASKTSSSTSGTRLRTSAK